MNISNLRNDIEQNLALIVSSSGNTPLSAEASGKLMQRELTHAINRLELIELIPFGRITDIDPSTVKTYQDLYREMIQHLMSTIGVFPTVEIIESTRVLDAIDQVTAYCLLLDIARRCDNTESSAKAMFLSWFGKGKPTFKSRVQDLSSPSTEDGMVELVAQQG